MRKHKLLVLAMVLVLCISSTITASAAGFDASWYAKQNPDVVKQVGTSAKALEKHYKAYGMKEGRMANATDVKAQFRRLFNATDYAAMNPDIAKAFGNNTEAMFEHYVSFGLLEGRRASNKMSYATAATLKTTLTKAMKDAGLNAAPGSADLKVIMNNTVSNVTDQAVKTTMAKVQATVEKTVTDTIKTVNTPVNAAIASSSSESESTSSSSSAAQTHVHTWVETHYDATCFTPEQTVRTCSVCGACGPATVVGVPLEHSYASGHCQNCGTGEPNTDHEYFSMVPSSAGKHHGVCQATQCNVVETEDEDCDQNGACGRCSVCGYAWGSEADLNHNWSNHDGQCANTGCGYQCPNAHTSGTTCDICGKVTPSNL